MNNHNILNNSWTKFPVRKSNYLILFRNLAEINVKMEGKSRNEVKVGSEVGIVLKEDQRTGEITEGIVQDILTNSSFHPHGIKVRLTTGEVGRVKLIK